MPPQRINHRATLADRQAGRHLRALQFARAYREAGTWFDVALLFGVSLGLVQHTMRAACPPALFRYPARTCAQCGGRYAGTGLVYCSVACRTQAGYDARNTRRRRKRRGNPFKPDAPLLAIAHRARAEIEGAERSKP